MCGDNFGLTLAFCDICFEFEISFDKFFIINKFDDENYPDKLDPLLRAENRDKLTLLELAIKNKQLDFAKEIIFLMCGMDSTYSKCMEILETKLINNKDNNPSNYKIDEFIVNNIENKKNHCSLLQYFINGDCNNDNLSTILKIYGEKNTSDDLLYGDEQQLSNFIFGNFLNFSQNDGSKQNLSILINNIFKDPKYIQKILPLKQMISQMNEETDDWEIHEGSSFKSLLRNTFNRIDFNSINLFQAIFTSLLESNTVYDKPCEFFATIFPDITFSKDICQSFSSPMYF